MKLSALMLAAGSLFAASFALSTIHPWGDPRATPTGVVLLQGSDVPTEVNQILENKCADCHAGNTRWPLYSRLAPGSWLIERDIHEARTHLNLSAWQHYDLETRIDLLSKIASEAHTGGMPVRQYLILHPSARLTPSEQQLLYDWAKSERRRLKKQFPTDSTSAPAN